MQEQIRERVLQMQRQMQSYLRSRTGAFSIAPLIALVILMFLIIFFFGLILVVAPLFEGVGTQTAESLGVNTTTSHVFTNASEALSGATSDAASNQGMLVPVGILITLVAAFGLGAVISKAINKAQ